MRETFYQVTGFREVVIEGVLREQLRRSLAVVSTGFIIVVLTTQ